MPQFAYYESPFGILKIGYREGFITHIRLVPATEEPDTPSPVSDLAARQLIEYFCGCREIFDFPSAPAGTSFQMQVWEALSQIPFGQTRTYGEIAAAIGKPGAARAVGQACNQNPIWIAIPCHRVLGAKNALTGYAGGIDIKKRLLDLEQKQQ